MFDFREAVKKIGATTFVDLCSPEFAQTLTGTVEIVDTTEKKNPIALICTDEGKHYARFLDPRSQLDKGARVAFSSAEYDIQYLNDGFESYQKVPTPVIAFA